MAEIYFSFFMKNIRLEKVWFLVNIGRQKAKYNKYNYNSNALHIFNKNTYTDFRTANNMS